MIKSADDKVLPSPVRISFNTRPMSQGNTALLKRGVASREMPPSLDSCAAISPLGAEAHNTGKAEVDRGGVSRVLGRSENWMLAFAWATALCSITGLAFLARGHLKPPNERPPPFVAPIHRNRPLPNAVLPERWMQQQQREIEIQDIQIPRLIHQTYKTDQIPKDVQPFVQSWKEKNPGWKYLFYTDLDCVEFVRREFPEYLDAYNALPKNVERSDFFRYMVILRHGGLYADVDTECVVPLDDFIRPENTLVAGWECDASTDLAAFDRHFVRRRQVLQWVFAAVPGHPALKEVCEFIAANARRTISPVSTNHDTLERTGPGAWTDCVLRQVLHSEPGNRIRLLPQVAFGTHPTVTDTLDPASSLVLVRHHFRGSWKSGGWGSKAKQMSVALGLKSADAALARVIRPLPVIYFPVSANFTPPFTVMVHAAGHGDSVGEIDISNAITRRGVWQSGEVDPKPPRLVDVIAGSLGDRDSELGLLDVGAGLGYFSLAAVSRQHPVLAIETSEADVHPLHRSIRYNRFEDLLHLYPSLLDFETATQLSCTKSGAVLTKCEGGSLCRGKMTVEGKSFRIGVIRVGQSGWDLWKTLPSRLYLECLEPEIVAIEYAPLQMQADGWEDPSSIFQKMTSLGYQEVYHAGVLCLRRFEEWPSQMEDMSNQGRPAWCKLTPSDFEIFNHADGSVLVAPENILFVRGPSNSPRKKHDFM